MAWGAVRVPRANGAGKTTAMRIALGMLTAVYLVGRVLGVEERKRIEYMPGECGLYGRMRPAEQIVYLVRPARRNG